MLALWLVVLTPSGWADSLPPQALEREWFKYRVLVYIQRERDRIRRLREKAERESHPDVSELVELVIEEDEVIEAAKDL